uniref:Uncharacterized protein n=1 Tax=Hemiselmis andersenii TaxID=464988 RepID=A0A7S1HC24_HEMAN
MYLGPVGTRLHVRLKPWSCLFLEQDGVAFTSQRHPPAAAGTAHLLVRILEVLVSQTQRHGPRPPSPPPRDIGPKEAGTSAPVTFGRCHCGTGSLQGGGGPGGSRG